MHKILRISDNLNVWMMSLPQANHCLCVYQRFGGLKWCIMEVKEGDKWVPLRTEALVPSIQYPSGLFLALQVNTSCLNCHKVHFSIKLMDSGSQTLFEEFRNKLTNLKGRYFTNKWRIRMMEGWKTTPQNNLACWDEMSWVILLDEHFLKAG